MFIVIPADSYFVMGDNRDNSDDSRSWGFVKDEDILGRAMRIWMSWDSSKNGLECLRECIRWNRFGNSLGTPIQNAQ
jgi:signal peptidase I